MTSQEPALTNLAPSAAAFPRSKQDLECDRHFGITPEDYIAKHSAAAASTLEQSLARLHINAKQLLGRPLMCYEERMMVDPQVPYLNTSNRSLTLNGRVPITAMIDTGAKPVMIGSAFAALLGLVGSKLGPAPYKIVSATETVEAVLGVSLQPVEFVFSTGSAHESITVHTPVLVLKAQAYDVLLGQDILFQIGAIVDMWQNQLFYHPDIKTDGSRLAAIPMIHPMRSRGASRRTRRVAATCHAAFPSNPSFSPVSYDSDNDEEEFSAIVCQPALAISPSLAPTATTMALQRLSTAANQLYHQAKATASPLTRVKAVHSVAMPLPASVHHAVRPTVRPLLQSTVHLQPNASGYVVLDLFSGISTQLRVCLQNGLRIKSYYAVENDSVARTVAHHHCQQLQQAFSSLLPASALHGFQDTLPNDIRTINRQQLSCLPQVDLVFAGWECQGHSSAGVGLGLADPRSSLFFELTRVVNILEDIQMLHPTGSSHPFAYIFENVAFGFDRRQHIRNDFRIIQHHIGEGVVIDAARHGSHAHPLRAFWTTLVDAYILHSANNLVQREFAYHRC